MTPRFRINPTTDKIKRIENWPDTSTTAVGVYTETPAPY